MEPSSCVGWSPLKRQSVYAVRTPQRSKLVKLAGELTIGVIGTPPDLVRLSDDIAPLIHTGENFYSDGLRDIKGLRSANGN